MKIRIKSLQWAPLRIDFFPQYSIEGKTGFYIFLQDEDDLYGVGEYTASETLSESPSESNLLQISQIVQNQILDLENLDFEKPLFNLFSIPLSDSMFFAFEQALFHLLLQRGKLKLTPKIKTKLNALILPAEWNIQTLPKLSKNFLQQKFSTIKIKVGRASLNEDISLIKKLVDFTGGAVPLRLDANGLFKKGADILTLERELQGLPIEYLEDPFSYGHNKNLYQPSSIPWAIDEPLRSIQLTQLISEEYDPLASFISPSITTFILKPSLLKGLHQTFKLMKATTQRGKRWVLSSNFDSPITLMTLAQMAGTGTYADTNTGTHGLGTLRFIRSVTMLEKPSPCNFTRHWPNFCHRPQSFFAECLTGEWPLSLKVWSRILSPCP